MTKNLKSILKKTPTAFLTRYEKLKGLVDLRSTGYDKLKDLVDLRSTSMQTDFLYAPNDLPVVKAHFPQFYQLNLKYRLQEMSRRQPPFNSNYLPKRSIS